MLYEKTYNNSKGRVRQRIEYIKLRDAIKQSLTCDIIHYILI